MKKVGVIGAGVMGIGVAQSFAQFNYKVMLIDTNQEILEKAKESIYNNLRFQAFFSKEKAIESPEAVLERITLTTDFQELRDINFVIENVPEVWEIKEKVYLEMDKITPSHCIYMVNTSCTSITKIAGLVKDASRVIGTHFMNPVPMKPVIEVIRGYHTSDETITETKEILASINKEGILVNDFPGFVSNRISHLLFNEAAFIVQEQVASPKDIDDIFKKCFGHKMGPLETVDLIGLDTVVDSLDVLYESYQDTKFRCCPLLKKMVHAGKCGKKTGEGFYEYENIERKGV